MRTTAYAYLSEVDGMSGNGFFHGHRNSEAGPPLYTSGILGGQLVEPFHQPIQQTFCCAQFSARHRIHLLDSPLDHFSAFSCDLDSSKERSEFAGILSEIFQDTSICSPRREQVFSQAGILCDLLARYLASQLKPLQSVVDALRSVLLAGYLKREFEFDNVPSYSRLYGYFGRRGVRSEERGSDVLYVLR